MLDVACGTGVVTRQAARRVGAGGHVLGVDLNASMLAMARTFPQPHVWKTQVFADALAPLTVEKSPPLNVKSYKLVAGFVNWPKLLQCL